MVINVGPLDIDATLAGAGQVVSSTFQIRFGQNDNATWVGGDGVTFDNVVVAENTCPQPTNVAVASPNTDALVTWTNGAPTTQEFILEYGPSGFVQVQVQRLSFQDHQHQRQLPDFCHSPLMMCTFKRFVTP